MKPLVCLSCRRSHIAILFVIFIISIILQVIVVLQINLNAEGYPPWNDLLAANRREQRRTLGWAEPDSNEDEEEVSRDDFQVGCGKPHV